MLTIEESRRRWELRDSSHGITARVESADASRSRSFGWRDGLAAFYEWNEAQAIAQAKGWRNWYEKAARIAQAHRQAGKARTPSERQRRR